MNIAVPDEGKDDLPKIDEILFSDFLRDAYSVEENKKLDMLIDQLSTITPVNSEKIKDPEIQELVLSILMMYSKNLEGKLFKTMKQVEGLQKEMNSLDELLNLIRDFTDDKTGELEIKDDKLKTAIENAKKIGLEFEYDEKKTLSKFERDNLVENVNNVIRNKNTEFTLQSKKADRLNSERTEMMKYSYMIMKTLHDVFMKIIRLIRSSSGGAA